MPCYRPSSRLQSYLGCEKDPEGCRCHRYKSSPELQLRALCALTCENFQSRIRRNLAAHSQSCHPLTGLRKPSSTQSCECEGDSAPSQGRAEGVPQ